MRSHPLALARKLTGWLSPILLLAACAGDTRAPADSAATAEAVPSAAAFVSPVDGIPPAVIRAALNDGGRWQPYPEEVDRLCKGTTDCDAGRGRTRVRLWSDTGSRRLSYADAGAGAILIGKIHNLGGAYTRRYNLAPGRMYAVYLMRDGGTAGGGRYEIWFAQGNTKTFIVGGQYVECNHPERENPYSYAVFTNCDNPPDLARAQAGPNLKWNPGRHLGDTGSVARRAWNHEDGPAWFTCTSGCCTADPQ